MREELRVEIVPSKTATRIVACLGHRTVLRAKLPLRPWHRQALPMFLKALGRWQPLPIRAVLVVDDKAASFATSLYPDWFHDFGGDGYALEVVNRRQVRDEP